MINERKFTYTFDASTVNNWVYCPTCGSELTAVYPGDFSGRVNCVGGSCANVFSISYRGAGEAAREVTSIGGLTDRDDELIDSLYEEIADLHKQLMEERTWKKLTRRTGRT